MSIEIVLSICAIFVMGMFVAGLLLLKDVHREEKIAARVRVIHGEGAMTQTASDLARLRDATLAFATKFGQAVTRSGLISGKAMTDLEKTVAARGIRGSQAVAFFVSAKILLLAGMPFLAWTLAVHMELSGTLRTLMPAAAGVIGLIAPDYIADKLRARYLSRLEDALPDALDMMVICAQAGLGLGPAVIRVANELTSAYRDLAYEFALTANELQISTDSRVPLANLGLRTDLDSLKRLGATLTQTIQYGTPLTDALRTLSAELRHEAMVRLETRAARLPVMLTMPTIVFILPCVFMIAGGPSMLQVMKMFKM
jgi:tight adherence protein C